MRTLREIFCLKSEYVTEIISVFLLFQHSWFRCLNKYVELRVLVNNSY